MGVSLLVGLLTGPTRDQLDFRDGEETRVGHDARMLAWCLSGHLCPHRLGFQERRSVARAAHITVIFISSLSCFIAHRKEWVLAIPRPW